jgi:DNA-binding GntR family transcriptional regulator
MLNIEENQNLSAIAYQQIEELIVTLELPPGTVFSEADLSRQLNIGRTPVREALQRLTTDQLVITLPRRGMMVTEINIASHLALLETRRVLEKLIIAKAAKRASSGQKAALQECAKGIVEAAENNDLVGYMRFDQNFHQISAAASGNPYAVKANAPFHAHCRRFWYYYKTNGDIKRLARFHADMMYAVIDADEDKAAALLDEMMDYLAAFTRAALNL